MGKLFPKRLNHVILLGAGASYTSGYPIGQELRLLTSSKEYFKAKLEKLYPTPFTEPWSSKLSSGFFNQDSDKALAWRVCSLIFRRRWHVSINRYT